MRSVKTAVLSLILAVYAGLGLATIITRAPWCDEAWFGNPAYNLAYKGYMGTTVLDPASSTWKKVKLTGIDRHTYWVMPLSLLWNAGSFRLLGFGNYQMRVPSLLWGALTLFAWWITLRRLTGRTELALAGVALVAIDFHFQTQAADGRMEMMTVGLGYCAIAVYMALRERSLLWAVGASQALSAAACFTHPNGALLTLQLICATLYFDWKSIRLKTLLVAAAPYLLFAAGWGMYIARDPSDFVAQFLGNASGRGPTFTTPLAAIQTEIEVRYMNSFGLADWASKTGRLNLLPLIVMLGGTIAATSIRDVRRQKGAPLILLWTLLAVLYLTALEGLKTHVYLLYVTQLYSVLVAIVAFWLWEHRPPWRIAVAAVLTIFVALQAGRTVVVASRNPKGIGYQPAVSYLWEHFDRNTFIMGGAGLLFGLGPDWNILDDYRLGYNTGKRAEVIVIDEHWEDSIQMLQETGPPIYAHVERVLATEYHEVYRQGGYRILLRNQRASVQGV